MVEHHETRYMKQYTFDYSNKFIRAVNEFHAGKENLPGYEGYIKAHLGGRDGRLSKFVTEELSELEYHCGPLKGRRVLDFGAGTGAITTALAMYGAQVVAFDIDRPSLDLCALRLNEHGLSENVSIVCNDDFGQVASQLGEFDLVMMHAVIEHIPISINGLRKRLVGQAFESLKYGGYLYVNETPNRLWPKDIHTTGLWFLPWMRPGSEKAYKRAIAAGRHLDYDGAPHSPGPLGLEERGGWGMTYCEFTKMFPKGRYEVLNALPKHNRHVRFGRHDLSTKRRMLENLIYWTFTKPLKIPIVAFAPMFSPIIVRKM